MKDISRGEISGAPSSFARYKRVLLFLADDGKHGTELWRTDGTARGTKLIKDINPDGDSASVLDGVVYEGKLHFTADDGKHGEELWTTDGTRRGTKMLKDIWPGFDGGFPGGFAKFKGRLYFSASADQGLYSHDHGAELWRTDGTRNGTRLFKEINPGRYSSNPSHLRAVLGKLVFFARDEAHGAEPWISDGTKTGTRLVKDIATGDADSLLTFSDGFTVLRNRLVFTAVEGSYGHELWQTNGTAQGTGRVSDIRPGPADSFPEELTVFKGGVFFGAYDARHESALWRTDGTPAGTGIVKAVGGEVALNPKPVALLTRVDDRLFFVANDRVNGRELWVTDGTP